MVLNKFRITCARFTCHFIRSHLRPIFITRRTVAVQCHLEIAKYVGVYMLPYASSFLIQMSYNNNKLDVFLHTSFLHLMRIMQTIPNQLLHPNDQIKNFIVTIKLKNLKESSIDFRCEPYNDINSRKTQ